MWPFGGKDRPVKKLDVQALERKLRHLLRGSKRVGEDIDVPLDHKEFRLVMRALDYCVNNKIFMKRQDGTFMDVESWQVLRDRIRRQVL